MSSLRERFADESFWKRLSALRLFVFVRRRTEGHAGLWTTRRVGMSLEFAEYREYHPGDDFRYVDWNLFGRLDRLFVKVFHREEDVPIYVLLDTSRSMAIGDKLEYAVELAGAIAYLGLKEMNRVGGIRVCTRSEPRGAAAGRALSYEQGIELSGIACPHGTDIGEYDAGGIQQAAPSAGLGDRTQRHARPEGLRAGSLSSAL